MTDPKSISLRVPNAVFFVTGLDAPEMPKIEREGTVWSTSSCVAIGCTPDVDGETRIAIGSPGQLSVTGKLVLDSHLPTPSRLVRFNIVPGKTILEQEVSGTTTRVRVWVNDPKEPNDITIGLG
jgi:hypothetical protein